jgi:uncharacterized coiled-coil DUF342 family protein
MSQFIDTDHANESYRRELSGYDQSRSKIKNIREKLKAGEGVSDEEILWLCGEAEHGIDQAESSWYDHG